MPGSNLRRLEAAIALVLLTFLAYSIVLLHVKKSGHEGAVSESPFVGEARRIAEEARKLAYVPVYGRIAARIAYEAERLAYNGGPDAAARIAELRRELNTLEASLRERVEEALAYARRVLALYNSSPIAEASRAAVAQQLGHVRIVVSRIEGLLSKGLVGDAYIEALRLADAVKELEAALPAYLEAAKLAKAIGVQLQSRGLPEATRRLLVDALRYAEMAAATYPPNTTALEMAASLASRAELWSQASFGPGVWGGVRFAVADAEKAVSGVGDAGVQAYLRSVLEAVKVAAELSEEKGLAGEAVHLEAYALHVALLASGWRLYTLIQPKAAVSGGVLNVTVPGTVDYMVFYSRRYTEPQLVVYTLPVNETRFRVRASLVAATPFYTSIIINVSKLIERLKPGEYTVVLLSPKPGGGYVEAARLQLLVGNGSLKPGGVEVRSITVNPCGTVDYYRAALLCGVSPPVLAALRAVVWNSSRPSLADAIWELASWLAENIAYSEGDAYGVVQSPLELLESRSGVCRDYAVFSAASLLAAGARYSLVLVSLPGRHAFAAVDANGTLIAVDRGLPPAELQDYLEHVLGVGWEGITVVYNVTLRGTGEPVVVECLEGCRLGISDSYPADTIPHSIVRAAEREALKLAGVSGDPSLALAVAFHLPHSRHARYVIVGPHGRVDVASLYTPMFSKQWIRMLAELGAGLLECEAPACRGWIVYSLNKGYIGISAIVLPADTPMASLNLSGDIVKAIVWGVRLPRDLWKTNIVAYSLGGGEPAPCGIAIPLWTVRVSLVKVVYVDSTECNGSTCTLAVSLGKLAGSCVQPVLVSVEYDGYPIATMLVGSTG